MAWPRLFCASAQPRPPRVGALLKRLSEGGHGLLKARCPALPLAQGRKSGTKRHM